MSYRRVEVVHLTVCKDGHVQKRSEPRLQLQYFAICGHWVWADANYCHRCGNVARINKGA